MDKIRVITAMAAYSCSDAFMKLQLDHYSLAQSNAIRASVRVIFLVLSRPNLNFGQPKLHILYWLLALIRTFSFIYAVKYVPLPIISIITYSSSIFTLLISKLILGESIKFQKYISVLLCSLGIWLALGWEETDLLGLIVTIIGSVITSIDKLLIRKLSQTSSSSSIILGSNLFLIVCSLFWPESWIWPSLIDFGIFVCAGMFALGAQILNTKALSNSTGATLAPYYYTIFVFGTLNNWVITLTIPSVQICVGMFLVIVGSFLG